MLGEPRLSELQEAWKSERRDWARQRLRVMRLVARHEHSAQEIADVVGVSRATVFNYLRVFEQKGVEGLLQILSTCPADAPDWQRACLARI